MVEDHTEHQLRKLGHTVYNCSQCAGSNASSLARAKKFLAGEPVFCPEVQYKSVDTVGPTQILQTPFKVDWVVWFHTELSRDSVYLNRMPMHHAMKLVYAQYFDFVIAWGQNLL